MLAAVIPFPREEVTPPVTKTYFAIARQLLRGFSHSTDRRREGQTRVAQGGPRADCELVADHRRPRSGHELSDRDRLDDLIRAGRQKSGVATGAVAGRCGRDPRPPGRR